MREGEGSHSGPAVQEFVPVLRTGKSIGTEGRWVVAGAAAGELGVMVPGAGLPYGRQNASAIRRGHGCPLCEYTENACSVYVQWVTV